MLAAISRQNALFNLLCFRTHHHVSSSSFLWLLNFSTSSQTATQERVYQLLLQKHSFSPESASRVSSALTSLRNPQNADSALSFLKETGFSKAQLEKMVNARPSLLSAELEKTIKPKIQTFQDLGLSASQVAKLISSDPAILKTSLNHTIVPALAQLRRHLGSDVEVAKYLNKSGSRFLRAELNTNLVPNFEFLKNRGVDKNRINWLLFNYPRIVLGKPRLKVMEMLESKNLIRSWPCFSTLCGITDQKFYEKFVDPYFDDVGDVYMAMGGKR